MPQGDTYMSFLSIDWTLVFMLCNTLILFLLMKHFFFKPVKKMIDSRQKEVEDIFDEANKAQTDAQNLKSEYEKHLSNARAEANEIINTAQKHAQIRSDEIIKEAHDKSAAMIAKADEEIKLERTKVLNDVKGEISDMAVMIAEKVVEKDINSKDHEKLIEQFIDGVGDTTWKE